MIESFTAAPSSPPSPEWSLYGEGHVIAGSIIVGEIHVEAQILLDGTLLYRSRHSSHDVAREELMALRGHWANEGWSDPN
jgi:hypothetical protein